MEAKLTFRDLIQETLDSPPALALAQNEQVRIRGIHRSLHEE
jgi:hypothetical protein